MFFIIYTLLGFHCFRYFLVSQGALQGVDAQLQTTHSLVFLNLNV